jgi:hypothetical protein
MVINVASRESTAEQLHILLRFFAYAAIVQQSKGKRQNQKMKDERREAKGERRKARGEGRETKGERRKRK